MSSFTLFRRFLHDRGRLASIVIAVCSFSATATAQPAASAILEINVPTGLLALGSWTDVTWWIYLDDRIVGSSDRVNAVRLADGIAVPVPPSLEFWDKDGLVARTQSGMTTYVRRDRRKDIFSSAKISLPPGAHRVELMANFGPHKDHSCFDVTKRDLVLEPGSTQVVDFGEQGLA